MAVYFGEDERFIPKTMRMLKYGDDGGGQIHYAKPPIPAKIGPGYYFDSVNDYNRNWNTKLPRKEPMSLGAPVKRDPKERLLSAKLPAWIVQTGTNYKRGLGPGPGTYTPYPSTSFGKAARARPKSSSASGRPPPSSSRPGSSRAGTRGAAAATGDTGDGIWPGGATSSSCRPGTASGRMIRTNSAIATTDLARTGSNPFSRFPSGSLRKGIYLENNRLEDGIPASPGPGTYNLENAKVHFQLMHSHNSKALTGPAGQKSLMARSSYEGMSERQAMAMSAPGRGSGVKLGLGLGLGEASEYNLAGGEESRSTVSLSMSEQMALVS